MKEKFKILILLAIFIIGGLIFLALTKKNEDLTASTDRKNYERGEYLAVDIKNEMSENICFSSCYPYLLESEKMGAWMVYPYIKCRKKDLIEKCLKPKNFKLFELNLRTLETKKGNHRMSIPICINCKIGEKFRTMRKFYSNNFKIQ